MDVWVAVEMPYEGGFYVIGVYSSVKKAMKAVERNNKFEQFDWIKMGGDWHATYRGDRYEVISLKVDEQ